MEEATFTIYAMGEAGWIHQILNAVAMTRTYSLLAFTGAIIGLIVMGLMVARDGSKAFTPQDFLVGVAIFTLFFGTRVDGVVVEDWQPDPITGYQQMYVVDNVPAGLAVLGTGLSSMGVYLAELFEQNFGDGADTVRASGGGYGHTLERFSRLRDLASASVSDPEGVLDSFRESSFNYLRDCTLKGIQAKEIKESEIYKANDPLAGIAYDHPWFVTEVVTQNGQREQRSCRDARGELASVRDKLPEALRSMSADKRMNGVGEIAQRFLAGTLGQSAVRMQDFMASLILSRLIASAAATNGGFGDSAMTMTAILEQASAQRNVQWVVEDSMFRRVLRPVVSFFEALCYALAPLAAFLFGLGRAGWSLALKYLILPVWVVMFFPLVAITDAFGQRKFEFFLERYAEASQGLESGASSIAGMNEIMVNAMDAIGTSAMLGASVPALALMLLFGGAVTATHLAGRFQGGDFVDEKTAAPDAIKTAPVMSVEGRRDVDAFGSTMTAAAGGFRTYSRNEEMSHTLKSAEGEAKTAGDKYMQGLSNALSELFKHGENVEKNFMANLTHALKGSNSVLAKVNFAQSADGGWVVSTGSEDSNSGSLAVNAYLGASVGSKDSTTTNESEGTSANRDVSATDKAGVGPGNKPGAIAKGAKVLATVARSTNIAAALFSLVDGGVRGTIAATETSTDKESTGESAGHKIGFGAGKDQAIGRELADALNTAISDTYKQTAEHSRSSNVTQTLSELHEEAWQKNKAFEDAQAASSGRSVREQVSEDDIYTKMVNQVGRTATDAFLNEAEKKIGAIGLGASLANETTRLEHTIGDSSEQGQQQLRAAAIMATLNGSNPALTGLDPSNSDERTSLYSEMLNMVFNSGSGTAVDGGAVANEGIYTRRDDDPTGVAATVSDNLKGLNFTALAVERGYAGLSGDVRSRVDDMEFAIHDGRVALRGGNLTPEQTRLLEEGSTKVLAEATRMAERTLERSEVNTLLSGYVLAAQQEVKGQILSGAIINPVEWVNQGGAAGMFANSVSAVVGKESERGTVPDTAGYNFATGENGFSAPVTKEERGNPFTGVVESAIDAARGDGASRGR